MYGIPKFFPENMYGIPKCLHQTTFWDPCRTYVSFIAILHYFCLLFAKEQFLFVTFFRAHNIKKCRFSGQNELSINTENRLKFMKRSFWRKFGEMRGFCYIVDYQRVATCHPLMGKSPFSKRYIPMKKSIDRFFHGGHVFEQNDDAPEWKLDLLENEKSHKTHTGVQFFGLPTPHHALRTVKKSLLPL